MIQFLLGIEIFQEFLKSLLYWISTQTFKICFIWIIGKGHVSFQNLLLEGDHLKFSWILFQPQWYPILGSLPDLEKANKKNFLNNIWYLVVNSFIKKSPVFLFLFLTAFQEFSLIPMQHTIPMIKCNKLISKITLKVYGTLQKKKKLFHSLQ